jgi:hypothetical protein
MTTTASATRLDMSDISVDLMQHVPSGDTYATVWASEWDEAGEQCIGARIIKIAGPLSREDQDELRRSKDFDGDDGDLEWANDQQWRQVEEIA